MKATIHFPGLCCAEDEPGDGGGGGSGVIDGLDTSGLVAGSCVAWDGAGFSITPTDCKNPTFALHRLAGVFEGFSGEIVSTPGKLVKVRCSARSGPPTVGWPLFLSFDNADGNGAADRGAVCARPAQGIVGYSITKVGLCADASQYGVDGTVVMEIQPQDPILYVS